MENKFQKIINFLLKYGLRIIAIIIGIIGILSIFITAYFDCTFYHPAEKTFFKYSIGIIKILVSLFIILLIYLLNKKILKKIPSIALLAIMLPICLLVFIVWINAMKLNPETDQKMIHDMAVALLNNKISDFTQTAQYLFLYPFQFGLTLFVSLIYKCFGTNYLYIEYINAICSIANMIIIYYISKLIFKNEKIQKILVILLGGFSLYWMFFNVHFYGNIIGLTLALVSLLFTILYLDKNNIYFIIPTAICIALSIIIKSNYNIFLCGIVLVLLLDIIKKWNLKILLVIPIFIVTYFIINFGYNLIFENTTHLNTSTCGVPMISYVYMGMSEPDDLSAGWYNSSTVDLFRENNYDTEKTAQKSKELISKRILYFAQNPIDFIKYYSEKIGSTWLNPTFQTIWCSLPGVRYRYYEDYANYISYHEKALSMVGGKLADVEENYFNIYQIITFIFATVGIFKISKDLDLKQAIIPIIFIGGFLFHILWETKAIYVIQYYFILLPYAALGINYFIEKLESTRK